ncbi:serine/threonine-protein phosphatase 7 long form homolog [Spinacia oleracea]|uniref:Serine/threonine-protein phosphatase 7 long form homolog n=3 Tax=Spinacia oleracea TaxID=3562 RepID=A0ABM3RTX6_SPIOL|nr:serine/threonine-protein phosphatase 7 long form homolog [Spinacia oleracea]XP_056682434.1 serine/threonine-protein phosphatase 7 long form homolog [Spinacia oleracea]XP_056685166.1 serine/threonine-protein phosphatase 7 long form homolog [Spinacia oleracea]XP_056693253.1 serine/threonine-protein phosphatase 7 long form homolog [Spinacia oleracea]XP_056697256.1 serine/threonine-protein phosphatase 7 long form homolog [Spinacia oleracea]XP_056699083.1 serine/threonine-protein phosphatase 7 l
MEPTIHPGPRDTSVLTLQAEHRSEDVWGGGMDRLLTCREHVLGLGEWVIHDRVLEFVRLAGFYGVHRLVGGGLALDRSLITALIERWRQETHTFHLAVGEATITLQDVAVLLGLRVHGAPVTGDGTGVWSALVEELLGIRPEPGDDGKPVLQGSSLRMTWLRRHFSQGPPDDAADIVYERFSRAYILALMGSILFADKSGDAVQLVYLPLIRDLRRAGTYSWGSATLAYLYRQMCRAARRRSRDIGGPLILLQLWSWEHIHIGRPRISRVRDAPPPDPEHPIEVDDPSILGTQHQRGVDPLACSWLRVHFSCGHTASGLSFFRDALDHQKETQMTWQPYSETVLGLLPEICRCDRDIWRSVVPLICFDIVEYHYPNRVMRQFGLEQSVPVACDTSVDLHNVDRRHKNKKFEEMHRKYVEEWRDRESRIVQGTPFAGHRERMKEYMDWYCSITRLLITPVTRSPPTTHYQPSSSDIILSHALADLASRCTRAVDSALELPPSLALPLTLDTLRNLSSSCIETLSRVGQEHILQQYDLASSQCTPDTSTSHVSRGRGFRPPRARPPPLTPPLRPLALTSPHPPPPPSPRPPPPPSPRPPPLTPPASPPASQVISSPPLQLLTYRRQKGCSPSQRPEPIAEEDESSFSSSEHSKKQRRT